MQVEGQRGMWQHFPPATGALVSNTYATCPAQGNSPEKFGLMPHGPREPHGSFGKDSSVQDGHAFH